MDVIELLKSAFLGLVEGITEWLPISSTGHMILVDEFIKLNVTEEFWNMFLVVIQLGAILAVCVLFLRDLLPFGFGKTKQERRDTWSCGARSSWAACLRRSLASRSMTSWRSTSITRGSSLRRSSSMASRSS